MRRHQQLEGRPPSAAVLGPDRRAERLHPQAPAPATVPADRAQAGEAARRPSGATPTALIPSPMTTPTPHPSGEPARKPATVSFSRTSSPRSPSARGSAPARGRRTAGPCPPGTARRATRWARSRAVRRSRPGPRPAASRRRPASSRPTCSWETVGRRADATTVPSRVNSTRSVLELPPSTARRRLAHGRASESGVGMARRPGRPSRASIPTNTAPAISEAGGSCPRSATGVARGHPCSRTTAPSPMIDGLHARGGPRGARRCPESQSRPSTCQPTST